MSRVLTTLLLLQAGYAYVPYSSVESVIEQRKEGCYRALRQTQTTIYADKPDWQPWLLFFLRALRQQKRRLAEKIEREKRAPADLPELAVQILDYAQATAALRRARWCANTAPVRTRSRSRSATWLGRTSWPGTAPAARHDAACHEQERSDALCHLHLATRPPMVVPNVFDQEALRSRRLHVSNKRTALGA